MCYFEYSCLFQLQTLGESTPGCDNMDSQAVICALISAKWPRRVLCKALGCFYWSLGENNISLICVFEELNERKGLRLKGWFQEAFHLTASSPLWRKQMSFPLCVICCHHAVIYISPWEKCLNIRFRPWPEFSGRNGGSKWYKCYLCSILLRYCSQWAV